MFVQCVHVRVHVCVCVRLGAHAHIRVGANACMQLRNILRTYVKQITRVRMLEDARRAQNHMHTYTKARSRACMCARKNT